MNQKQNGGRSGADAQYSGSQGGNFRIYKSAAGNQADVHAALTVLAAGRQSSSGRPRREPA